MFWIGCWWSCRCHDSGGMWVPRYQAGAPLSVMDGVPYTAIDGLDALPYPTTAGTSFVSPLPPKGPCLHHSFLVVPWPSLSSYKSSRPWPSLLQHNPCLLPSPLWQFLTIF